MATITFDNFQSPARDFLPAVQTRPVKKVLFFSLLLHIALILAIASQNLSVAPSPSQPKSINARLFYAPPSVQQQIAAPPEVEPLPDTSLSAETLQGVTNKVKSLPEHPQAANSEPKPSISTPRAATEEKSKPSSVKTQPAAAPPPARRLTLGDIDAAREILRQQQAEAIQRDARQASAEYQRMKTQPQLIDPRKGIDKNAPEIKPLEINCDDTANAIIATISGLAGGTLQCSKRNAFEKFVEKRVNKTP